MGASYSFIFVYIIVDLIELAKEACSCSWGKLTSWLCSSKANVSKSKDKDLKRPPKQPYMPLVVINLQYFTLLLGTLFSGGFFGVLFGIIDIEKQFKNPWLLMWIVDYVELQIFAPVGLFQGATVGFIFMLLRFCENKLRTEREIFVSYGGTYIGYKDIAMQSSDEEEETPMLMQPGSFYVKGDSSEVDCQYEPQRSLRLNMLQEDSDEESFTLDM